jgi:hypothetical protein
VIGESRGAFHRPAGLGGCLVRVRSDCCLLQRSKVGGHSLGGGDVAGGLKQVRIRNSLVGTRSAVSGDVGGDT